MTELSELREGDRVRVVLTGTIDEDGDLLFDDPSARIYDRPYLKRDTLAKAESIERVEDLRDGDVYLDAEGDVVRYDWGTWYFEGDTLNDDVVQRPLTLLVRDGKKV